MIAQGRMVDLGEIETMARGLWRDHVEDVKDAEGMGIGVPMPTVAMPVDVVCSLIRRYTAPMTPQVKQAGQRIITYVEKLKALAVELRQQAEQVAGGRHMISIFPQAKDLMHRAAMAEMQAEDFLAILSAVPEPGESHDGR